MKTTVIALSSFKNFRTCMYTEHYSDKESNTILAFLINPPHLYAFCRIRIDIPFHSLGDIYPNEDTELFATFVCETFQTLEDKEIVDTFKKFVDWYVEVNVVTISMQCFSSNHTICQYSCKQYNDLECVLA